jgi:phosphate transport system ATP-binding protein
MIRFRQLLASRKQTIEAVSDKMNFGQTPPQAMPGSLAAHDGRASEVIQLDLFEEDLKHAPVIHPELARETPAIELDHFGLWYGKKRVLHDITISIPRGKITAIIGPSGCGKSSLIRSINRMNDLLDSVRYEGDIRLEGQSIFSPTQDVIQLRKRLGMVFQKPNPFPMSIFENVVYPLRIDGVRNRAVLSEVCERALRAAALWEEVKDRLHANALELSGGQQQRLCIARAIAADPEVLLLDEPCSALDPVATAKIEDLFDNLAGRYTLVIVTHNMQQAARVSDFTALLYLGRLLEFGPTLELFSRPRLKTTEAYITGRFG